jgi:type I restriction enzyme M protein
MLRSETKRHIDTARQVLVGVVPNPTSQIDQITNALIYKFMDDMDQSAIKQGDEPAFFVDDLEKYAWTRLMDSRLGNQERMNLYLEALNKFSEAKQLPELFRNIFKSAFLPYRLPEVLGLFLKEINHFDYSHPEDLGDGYEYLLSIMSSQGDAGQFRTPRHIIDFIVAAINPTKDDKILDPACGTAGFLISSYRHILKQHDGKGEEGKPNKEKSLTPDDRKKLIQNFEGYDIDPGMVRIAQVNMYLHQFKNPKIYQYDTLGMDERWNDKFDVILANPPFMSPKGGVRPHTKFSMQSSRSEVLFVDYIMNHLKPKGKAGVIVPEGIIFQSGSAYKQLRKNLVQDGLYAVVSLPSGVFQPYSGVKTSILLFDNELIKQKSEILFVKVENDGFDLGSNKRPISKNDLPTALDILNKWSIGEKVESKLAVYVEKAKIGKNDDYNLSGDRYRVATDYTNAKWPMVKLGEICEIFNGSTPKRTKQEYWENGTIPWFTIDDIREQGRYISNTKQKITEKGFKESSVRLLPKKSTLLCCTASIGECAYTEIELTTNQQFNGLVVKFEFREKLNSKFLFWCATTFKDELERMSGKATFGFVSVSTLKKFQIPLPPLEIQEQIVAELDGYAGIIAGAKQIAQNWKPKIDIDPKWEKVKLGEICETTSGGTPLKSKTEYYEGGNIPWLRSGEVAQGFIRKSELFITEKGLKNSSAKLLPANTVLVAMYGATAGQVGILKLESTTNQAICGILPNNKFVPEFLFQVLKDQKEIMISFAGGGAQPNISQGVIRDLEIPLPSLSIQRQIVEKIEAERALVESAKKLIDIYEQKTKVVIAKLWEE